MPPFRLNQSKKDIVPNINTLNDFPELSTNSSKEKEPVKSWANLINNNNKDIEFTTNIKKEQKVNDIDYFEDDINNIFDNKYQNIYYQINDKINEFCNINALPIYNTRSKLPNLVDYIKNHSTALDNIIYKYDNEDKDEYEDEDEEYESDSSEKYNI
jgi:hypothetical protein